MFTGFLVGSKEWINQIQIIMTTQQFACTVVMATERARFLWNTLRDMYTNISEDICIHLILCVRENLQYNKCLFLKLTDILCYIRCHLENMIAINHKKLEVTVTFTAMMSASKRLHIHTTIYKHKLINMCIWRSASRLCKAFTKAVSKTNKLIPIRLRMARGLQAHMWYNCWAACLQAGADI